MHAVGLHSALAIKRQRKRRHEQKVARERRYSSNSAESGVGESRSTCPSPHSSEESGEHHHHRGHRHSQAKPRKKHLLFHTTSNIGMLHLGIMFLIIGIFLVGAGLVPDDNGELLTSAKYEYARTLIATGAACILIGLFLILVNHCTTKQEEDDLKNYVERQLTRSRSGRRLIKDVETGGLKSKTKPLAKAWKPGSVEGDDDAFEAAPCLTTVKEGSEMVIPGVHHGHVGHGGHAAAMGTGAGAPLSPSSRSQPESPPPRSDLERILEEESSYEEEEARATRCLNQFNRETMSSNSEGCWSETQELLTTRFVATKN